MIAFGREVKRISQEEASAPGQVATDPRATQRAVQSNIPSRLVLTAIVQASPIGYRLSPLRGRPSPVAGYRGSPPRWSFRGRLVNATLSARPSRTAGRGYV